VEEKSMGKRQLLRCRPTLQKFLLTGVGAGFTLSGCSDGAQNRRKAA
jgi:hypothetical protein